METMDTVLTLIATPAAPDETGGVSEAIVAEVMHTLNDQGGAQGVKTADPDWLAPTIACNIPCSGIENRPGMADAVRAALGAAAVDVACLPREGRRKRLLLADMDSTIVTSETLDELAAFAGLKDKVAAITTRAMTGELDFEAALRERVLMLRGLSETALADTLKRVELTAGAATLGRTMAAAGAHLVLISGGFRYFTGPVRERAHFHADISNDLEIRGGKLTGRLNRGPIVDKTVKRDSLISIARRKDIPLADTMAVGDGANDGPMIKTAGLGVAFRGKPVLARVADVNILHSDLTALLYLQGYRAAEIINA